MASNESDPAHITKVRITNYITIHIFQHLQKTWNKLKLSPDLKTRVSSLTSEGLNLGT